MIKLECCPATLAPGFDTYSPKAVKSLFGGQETTPILAFDIEEFRDTKEISAAMHRISVSGVQEKFPAIIDGGVIKIAGDDQRSTHILKPAPWDKTLQNRAQIPANEHLTMQIAAQVYGIQTAANGLCFTPSCRAVYITKRFDMIQGGQKLPMEDFASVVGRNEQSAGTNFKYNGCYEDIALAIRKNVAAWRVDMERFFELVLFNYIYGNADDHLKNFTLILQGNDYRLAPAYDLLNTCLHIDSADFGLDGGLSPNIESSSVMDRTCHPCRLDFQRFGERIGIVTPRLNRILDKYIQMPELALALIGRSFLNDKMKRSYLRIVNERISRFIRSSDE